MFTGSPFCHKLGYNKGSWDNTEGNNYRCSADWGGKLEMSIVVEMAQPNPFSITSSILHSPGWLLRQCGGWGSDGMDRQWNGLKYFWSFNRVLQKTEASLSDALRNNASIDCGSSDINCRCQFNGLPILSSTTNHHQSSARAAGAGMSNPSFVKRICHWLVLECPSTTHCGHGWWMGNDCTEPHLSMCDTWLCVIKEEQFLPKEFAIDDDTLVFLNL